MRAEARAALAALLLPALLGAGCGDAYDLPVLAAGTPPRVRVLLRPDRPRLTVREQAWEIRSEEGGRFSRRGATDLELEVRTRGSTILLNGAETGAHTLRLRPDRAFEMDGTAYAGDLLLTVHRDAVRFVNEADLETYVAGVIGNEMGPDAPPAAYRAQSVAARTYAWVRIAARREAGFHVYDTQASQVYTGLSPRYGIAYEDMARRTAETRGVILTWENRPFPAYYASTCGGHTTDARTSNLDPEGATEPLRGVRCDFCRQSSRFSWEKTVRDADVLAGLERRGLPIVAPVHGIAVRARGPGGWVREVEVTYGPERRVRTVPGTEFRSALRLDSHLVDAIARARGGWTVQGRGWGHGVGMCQMGAQGMGARGFSESAILRWYYPGATFAKVY